MNKLLLLLTLGIFLSFGNTKAAETPRVVQGKSFITYGKSSKDIPLNAEQERSFTIDAAIATDIFQSGAPSLVISDFPVGLSETKTVELRPARPVADDQTKWMIGTKDGLHPMPAPRVISYEGFVDGEMKSSIFLTYFKGDITGMVVRDNGQRYVVAPEVNNYGTKHEHILTSEAHIVDQMGGKGLVCGNEDLAEIQKLVKESDQILVNSGDLLEARVAVDITNSFAKKFNNDYEKTQAYVYSLFGMVSRIYEEEINVTLILNVVNIYTELDSDPYKGKASGHELLPAMAAYWNQNISTPRDLAHLLSGPPPAGSGGQTVIGVAYLAKLCQPTSAYGVSLIFNSNISLPALTYIEDVVTITHEIGHTFGSPHTHVGGNGGYEPPIDSCMTSNPNDPAVYAGDAANKGPAKPPNNGIGTIMSYCHLRFRNTMQFTFGPRPQKRIRDGAEPCLKIPAKPAIYMQYPVGKQNLIAGAQEEIRWTSARVASVKVQYSIDGGVKWIDVSSSVLATDRKISWTVPQVSTTSLLVRVLDVSNEAVYDQTEATLTIAAPVLSLTKPTGGERIGQKETVSITWNKQLVNKVKIEFSADGQSGWQTIADSTTSSTFQWVVPAVVTSNAVIRITDANNGALVSQSSPFAIGLATATLKTPNGGELWGRTAKVWITWNSDFVTKVTLEYSTENGADGTWKPIKKPVNPTLDGSAGGYLWTVPDDLANNAVVVRIRNASTSAKEELDRSDAPFTIDAINGVEDEANNSAGLSIIGISPNPAGEEAYISFTANESAQSLKIELIDVTGQIVARFDQPNQFSAGEQSMKLDLKELPQGVYLLVLRNGMAQVSSSLRIVR